MTIATRRQFLASASLATLGLGCSGAALGAAERKRPNILLIVADDVGYTDIGAYGSEIATPVLDALASDGIRFTDFHTGMACSPTRSMLLSGVDAHLAGLGNMAEDLAPNQKGQPGYEGYLNFAVAPLPAVLRQAGYRTCMAGKWHLGMDEKTSPEARGFDRSFASLQGGAGHFANMLPILGDEKAKYREGHHMVESLPEDFYSTRYLTDRIIAFLDADAGTAKADAPFFAYLAYTAPHWPVQAPRESIDRYKGRYDAGYDVLFEQRLAAAKRLSLVPADVPGGARYPDQPAWDQLNDAEKAIEARRMEIFAAMVSDVDSNIGRLLDHLRMRGELDNTIILFMSDNGSEGHDFAKEWIELAEHAKKCCDNSLDNMGMPDSYIWMGPNWARASTAPFRMFKGYPSEGGTRVPFIVHYKGFDRRGITHARGHVTDVMPTLLELAGIPHPSPRFEGHDVHPMSGRSMVPFLEHRQPTVHGADAPFAQELFGKRSIRIGKWKALNMRKPHGTGEWQLYDLAADMSERNDLASAQPATLKRLVDAWHIWAKQNNVILPDWVSGY